MPLAGVPLDSTLMCELRVSTGSVCSLEAILESSEFRSLTLSPSPRMGLGSRLSEEVKLKRVLAGRSRRLPAFALTMRGGLIPACMVVRKSQNQW